MTKTAQQPQDQGARAKPLRHASAWTYAQKLLQDGPMQRGVFVQRVSSYATAQDVNAWVAEGKIVQEGVQPAFVALPKDATKARALADESRREAHEPPRYSAKIVSDLERHRDTAKRAAEGAKAQLRAEQERHTATMNDLSARNHDRAQEERARHEAMLRQLQAEHEVALDQERQRHSRRVAVLTQDEAEACRALGLVARALASLDTQEPAPTPAPIAAPVADVQPAPTQAPAPVEPKVLLMMGDQMLEGALPALNTPRRGKRPAPVEVQPVAEPAQEEAAQEAQPAEVQPSLDDVGARLWAALEQAPKGKVAHSLASELGLDVGWVRATLQGWQREGRVKVWNFTYSIPQKPEGIQPPEALRTDVQGKDLVYRLEQPAGGGRAGWKAEAPSSFVSWCEVNGHTGAFFYTLAEMKAAFGKCMGGWGAR